MLKILAYFLLLAALVWGSITYTNHILYEPTHVSEVVGKVVVVGDFDYENPAHNNPSIQDLIIADEGGNTWHFAIATADPGTKKLKAQFNWKTVTVQKWFCGLTGDHRFIRIFDEEGSLIYPHNG